MLKKIYLTNGVSFGGKYTVTSSDVAVTAVAEVVTLTVTSGCTVDGTVTPLLPGGATDDIAVTTSASTAAGVATLIAAGTYTGWTASATDAVVTFTASVAEAKTGTPTFTVGSTGVAGTIEVTTEGVTAVSGSVTFDFQSPDAKANVGYDMVASIMVRNSSNVFIPLTDAVITYPVNGQVVIADGSTFKLTAGYKIDILAQRSIVAV